MQTTTSPIVGRITPLIISIIFAALCLVAANIQAAPDDRLSPGARFYVDFPQLGDTAHGAPARMGISLPANYTLTGLFPMMVWHGGGRGSDSPNPARAVVGELPFICVGLPYDHPEGTTGGWFHTSWAYYKTMLDELGRIVPNIDPQRRVAAGFSSGAAAVCRMIGHSSGAYGDYFYAFMPGGSGAPLRDLGGIANQPFLGFSGDQDKRGPGVAHLVRTAKAAGVDAQMLWFENTGHSIAPRYYPEMQNWLSEKGCERGFATRNPMFGGP